MILSVQNAGFSYKGGREILSDINFIVGSGDIMAILGPNGVGKTTLLKCMLGFRKWNYGKSMLDGEDIAHMSPRRLWQKVAYVPQAKNMIASYTVLELILLGRAGQIGLFSKPGKKDFEMAYSALERLKITSLADKKCYEVSGGELQMALIAKALATGAKFIVLDEPESNLDFRNQLIILDTLSELVASGLTCIFNTHYPAHALGRANKALLLGRNNKYVFGPTRKVVTEENIGGAFGVDAVIGEIETPKHILSNIIPIELRDEECELTIISSPEDKVIAAISIISSRYDLAEQINTILHDYTQFVIGRMGMPYREQRLYIINLTLDAPRDKTAELSDRLGALPGVSVKATYAN